jgi:hypothetical protein
MDSERNNCGADATNGINFISFSALNQTFSAIARK